MNNVMHLCYMFGRKNVSDPQRSFYFILFKCSDCSEWWVEEFVRGIDDSDENKDE